MIISHKNKFIFIKTAKTAGTSIEVALSDICGPDDIITPLSKKDEYYRIKNCKYSAQNYLIPFRNLPKRDWIDFIYRFKRKKYYNHISALEILKYFPKNLWDEYYKFTFERNPFDKVVSYYFYTFKNKESPPSIHDFIQKGDAYKLANRGFELYSIKNRIAVDRVFFYERLEEEMNELAQELSLPSLDPPKKKLKGSGRNDQQNKDYRSYLSEEDREVIEKVFAREIAYFGYEF